MNTSRRGFFKAALAAGAALGIPAVLAPEAAEAKTADKPTYELTGEYGRFDQANTMFSRSKWDTAYMQRRAALKKRDVSVGEEHDAMALNFAGWYAHNFTAFMNSSGATAQSPLMRWDDPVVNMDEKTAETYSRVGVPKGDPMIWDDTIAPNCYQADQAVLSRKVKNAGKFLGASEVGIAKLDPRWVYSKWFDFKDGKSKPWPKDPAQFKYVVIAAIEMQYEAQADITSYTASASTGLGYSNMAVVASSLARFIRCLGYPSIPAGNDVLTTVPAAIEAGLGELGRHGLMITPKYGSRVRLCAVLTDAPLEPDKPVDMGVKAFCTTCGKCAEKCPNGSISTDKEPTEKVINMSNRPGVVRWPVNAEKCFDYWGINRSACNVCVSVCPYNREGGVWFHDITPTLIEKASPLDRALVFLDEFLGYGTRKPFKL